MNEPEKLGEIISELMALFRQRRELEARIQEGNGTAADCEKLEALNQRLQK